MTTTFQQQKKNFPPAKHTLLFMYNIRTLKNSTLDVTRTKTSST